VADLKLLQAGASELGLELTREQLSAFSTYMREMLKWNQRANLTAITAPDEIQTKHFLDSLTCLLAFPGFRPFASGAAPGDLPSGDSRRDGERGSLSCIDVGTGAGFPGVPLKICIPSVSLTLVDSIGKKTSFLSHLVQVLGLQDTRVWTGRAEDLARNAAEREQYDVVVARAVSRVAVVAELCLPLCRVGGRVISLKKGDMAEEIEEGRYAVEKLGGEYGETLPVELSLLGEKRVVVAIDKIGPTPEQYPRRAGIPNKRPLLAGSADGRL
jgi:16S rRNA (guanine527-N7)-methyltransferase